MTGGRDREQERRDVAAAAVAAVMLILFAGCLATSPWWTWLILG